MLKKMKYLIFLFFTWLSFNASANQVDVKVQPPSFFQKEATVVVKNEMKYSQIVKVDVSNNFNKANVLASVLLTIPPESTVIERVLPKEGSSFSDVLFWGWTRGVGDLTKEADRNGYQIPFDVGFETTVCQFPHGASPSIDFCAPRGTKIHAAKDGVVIWTVDKFGDGAMDASFFDKANLVELAHSDGSRALYTHLERNTLLVKEGQFVKKGEPIADVGLSGQTSGAHLHFHVVKLNKDLKEDFVEPIFTNSNNQTLELKNGNKMTRESSVANIVVPPVQVVRQAQPITCPNNDAIDDKAKAVDCYGKNQFELAIEYFQKHVKKNPNDALSLARLAIAHTRLNRHEEAVKAYKNAIAKNWISYDFASLYARSLYAIGEKDEAIKWNKRALVLVPACNDCRRDLAIQLKDMGKKKEAFDLLTSYDEKQKSQGKPQVFQGMIMLLEDELKAAK